ncbi:MAG: addiction module protein [Archangium sp.]|nr:addiction module protein [Archangium sp.]
MTAREREVLGEALRLNSKQRARLAAELLASIGGEPEGDADTMWTLELEKRAKRALAGKSVGTDWAVVRARIQKPTRR